MKKYSLIIPLLFILVLGVFSKSGVTDTFLNVKRELLPNDKGVSSKDTSLTIVISNDSKFVTIKNFNSADTYMITKRTVSYSIEDYTVYDKYENNTGFCLILNKSPDDSRIIMIEIIINNITYYYDIQHRSL